MRGTILAGIAFLATSATSRADSPPPPAIDPVAVELLDAHNRERSADDLPPLSIAPKLAEAARVQSRDMAEHATMAHEGTDGSTPADRVERQGYRYIRTGENVAYGQRSTGDVMRAWMNSPHHRDNILGDFTQMGAARVDDRDGIPYWCVVFGTPLPQLDPSAAASHLVGALNKARAEADVPPLTIGRALVETAAAEARRLADRDGRLDDEVSRGESANALQRLAKARARRYRSIGQSVAAGYSTADEVVKSLLNDPAQEKTLLGDFDQVGIGYANAEDGSPYWCIILAKTRK